MRKFFILTVLIISTAAACNDQLLEQIQEIHTQNTELANETAALVESLVQIRNQINVQGRALSEPEIARVEEIDDLEQRWLDWKVGFQSVDPIKAAEKEGKAVLGEQQIYQQALQALKAEAEELLKKTL